MLACPFFILHYKQNRERRAYLERALAGEIQPIYIEEFDREEFVLDEIYQYDETKYAKQLLAIKDCLIAGTMQQNQWKHWPWAAKVQCVRDLELTPEEMWRDHPWMRPYPLSHPDVSLILKHKLAWERIAAGPSDYAIIAEDDVVLLDHSLQYVARLLTNVPPEFDYIDIAGGVGLCAVPGDPVVNGNFYVIDPPRDRTTCCAIVHKNFARRLLAADLELVMPIDWMLTYLFHVIKAKVYWVEPVVFGHGSQMNTYPSNRLGDES